GGHIPDYILKNEKLMAELPAFFGALSDQKPSREDLETPLELSHGIHSHRGRDIRLPWGGVGPSMCRCKPTKLARQAPLNLAPASWRAVSPLPLFGGSLAGSI